METIRIYIDQMFKDLPKTKDVVEMKLNILDHMEEKYKELVEEGKTDSEASRMVIGEFGDMDEILRELDIEKEALNEDVNYIDGETVDEIIRWKGIYSGGIAAGVFLCILGVALAPFINSLFPGKTFGGVLTMICFFVPIALGVVLFIIFGIIDSKYKEELKSPVIDATKKGELALKLSKYRMAFAGMIAAGVFLCILAVCLYPLIEYLVTEEIAILVFFILGGVAVLIFIIAGMNRSKYAIFLNENTEEKRKEKEREERLESIQGVIMMSVTIVYIILGITMKWWHPGWVVFPVGGMVCAIVGILHGTKR